MGNGECVLTSKTSTRNALKIDFPCPELTCWSIRPSNTSSCLFWTPSRGIIRSEWHLSIKKKTLFVTDRVLYSYKVMSFGLKNTRATYQLLVNHMFKDQIWQNIKVYVKDMQMKSQYASIHLADLAETFGVMDDYSMKLNPTKCTFGVSLGKFLGFLVSHRGIEANHEKIQAII